MVDQYNDEFSRDIEPTRTGTLKDKAYIQTGMNVRNYAFEPAVHYNYPSVTVGVSDFEAENWSQASTFNDFVGEAISRNYPRFDGVVNLEDYSNRNDIDEIKVLRDKDNLYFRITTKDQLTKPDLSDTKWMNIWIRTNGKENENAIGFHYVLNKKLLSESTAQIIKYDEDGKEVAAGKSEFAFSGNVLVVKVPLKALGLDKNNYEIEFKVSDNIKNDEDILDFYSTGDSAPIGSMCYHYGY